MVLVLEDEQLESLQCSRCHKYLSIFPVKNHSNRDVTCGRCSHIFDDWENSAQSTLYELVAKEYLFRCVNRYEGCKKLLRAEETKTHETKCVGNSFDCPKCNDGKSMSILELIWHYKLLHRSSYLKNSFEGKPPNDDVILYIQDDVVFFISMLYKSGSLHLSAMTLTEVKATQVFSINRGSVWEKTKKKLCKVLSAFNCDHQVFNLDSINSIELTFNLEVSKSGKLYDISIPSTSRSVLRAESFRCIDQIESPTKKLRANDLNEKTEKTFKIKLAKGLKDKLGYKLTSCGKALLSKTGHRIDLTCSNCKQLIRLPIFTCINRKHNICQVCRAWCGICNTTVKPSYQSNNLLRKLSFYLSFPCKWQCGEYFNSDLRTHENSCKPKIEILKCPICLLEMDLTDSKFMDIHLLDNHQIVNFIGEYNVQQVGKFIGQKSHGELSFLFHDRYCYLKWSKNVYSNAYDSSYDLNFGFLGNEPNLKLDLIYDKHKLLDNNVRTKVSDYNLSYYEPYINFNYTK